MTAKDIALQAYQAVLDAEAAKQREQEEEDQRREQQIRERGWETFFAGLPTLQEWFPNVQWELYDYKSGLGSAGGYGWGDEVIVREAGDSSEDLLILMDRKPRYYLVSRERDRDTGYSYYGGTRIKSAADVGRFLAES